ncbi:MAG: PAS domain S-box protein [Cyanobacteria bacterium SID2]|nr:PAS domain S-box protein [Cyanobacteria bacterium SID2]
MKPVSPLASMAALAAGLAVGIGVMVLDSIEARRFDRQYRQTVLTQLNIFRATLEGEIHKRLVATQNLANLAASRSNLTPELFESFALQTCDRCPLLTAVIWQRDDGTRLAYPAESNDWPANLNAERPRLDVYVRADGAPLVFALAPGKDPFLENGRVKGTAILEIDVAMLIEASDLDERVSDLQFSVRATDAIGKELAILFGDPEVFDAQPVTGDVQFPSGAWQIAAVPASGWSSRSPLQGWIRFGGGCLTLGAGVLAFKIVGERQHRKNEIDRATVALQKQLDRYREIVEQANTILVTLDLEGRTTFANPYAQHFFGYAETEFSGQSFADLVLADDTPHLDGSMKRMGIEARFDSDPPCRRRNGELVAVAWHTAALVHDGERVGWLLAGRDATATLAAEAACKQSNDRLQTLVSSITERVVVLDRDGRCLDRMPTRLASERGFLDRVLVGQTLEEVLPLDRAQLLQQSVREAIEFGRVSSFEFDIAQDDRRVWFAAVVSPCVRETSRSELRDTAVLVVRDVSDRHQIEAELKSTQAELERRVNERAGQIQLANKRLQQEIVERMQADEALRRSEEREREKAQQLERTLGELRRTQAQLVHTEKMSSLGQLAAGMAHEINNPVNFIHGNLSPLSDYARDLLKLVQLYEQVYPNPPDSIRDWSEEIDLPFLQEDFFKVVASMRAGTERIRKIIESLKNFSRLDEMGMKRVDLHEGIESTLLIFQSRLRGRGNRPEIEVVKVFGDLPKVECFANQINQVLTSLIDNAIDAIDALYQGEHNSSVETDTTPISKTRSIDETPKIEIFTKSIDRDWVVVCVRDNGSGIPEDIQSHICNPFFTTKPVGQGTGLGLSIAYQIVHETHGGQLAWVSPPGGGTEFSIQLPVRQNADEEVGE